MARTADPRSDLGKQLDEYEIREYGSSRTKDFYNKLYSSYGFGDIEAIKTYVRRLKLNEKDRRIPRKFWHTLTDLPNLPDALKEKFGERAKQPGGQDDRGGTGSDHLSRTSTRLLHMLLTFQSPPTVIVSYFEKEPIHPADFEAYRTLSAQFSLVRRNLPVPFCSGDPRCPPHYTDQELLLICGPNGNILARQLNDYLHNHHIDAFHFKALVDNPEIGKDASNPPWVVCHPVFPETGLPTAGRLTDYGIIYVGRNPQNPKHYLVWIAGLGPHGTPGAALALSQMQTQLEICRMLDGGNADYVSVLVLCEFRHPEHFADVNVLRTIMSAGSIRAGGG